MRTYKRPRIPGGTYFFNLTLAERHGNDLLTRQAAALRSAFRRTLADRPAAVQAIVVLPDHLHCIWCLPERDDDFPTRWRLIKNRFSRQIQAGEPISPSRAGRGERGLWQRRYWEHDIRNEQDLRRHMDYIHYNPVKHGYVTAPPDWPFSSLHRWTARGYARPIGRHRSMWSTWRWVEGDGRFAFVPGNPSPLIRAAPS